MALAGIGFVLQTRVAWRDLPKTVGCFGVTCWQRLADWQAAGVWQAVPEVLLAELRAAGRLDLHRARRRLPPVCAYRGQQVGPPRSTGPILARNII